MDYTNIWQDIEDSIPDKMMISEYKDYILGFVFYRYLSDKQEQYLLTNNVIDICANQTINEAYCIQAQGDALADYIQDISSSLGYAIEPYDTWCSLISRIENGKVIPEDYQKMFDNFNKNSKLNKDAGKNFSDIFNDVKIADTRLGVDTNSRAKTLCKIVSLVDCMPFEPSAGKLFRELIGFFASKAGKTGGKFYTPQSVSQLMAQIVTENAIESETSFSVYDLACGSGSTLLELKYAVPGGDREGAIKFYGEEIELSTYNLARMNLFINGISSSNIMLKNTDTLGLDWPDGQDENGINQPRRFDAIVSDIEFSRKWDNSKSRLKDPRFQNYGNLAPKSLADYAFLLHGLYHLNEEGTMAMVVPHGVLFRGKAEETIRKNLIEHPSGNKIYAVIGLPENIMFSEKGKKSVAVVILVLKKKKNLEDILFIDASHDFTKVKNKNILEHNHILKIINAYKNRTDIAKYAHLASLDEVKRNDYNLNITRYVNAFEEELEINPVEVCNLLIEDEVRIKAAKKDFYENLRILGIMK